MSLNIALILFVNLFLLSYGHPFDSNSETKILKNARAVENSEYRLKQRVLPNRYVLEIEPFFADEGENKAFTFRGNVKIQLKVEVTGVKEIELHMHEELKYSSIALRDDQGIPVIREQQPTFEKETQKLKIPFADNLKVGVQYTLEIEYTGVLNDDLRGFYRTSYMHEGKKLWAAATQFEVTHARRAFPVFDEPLFKAVFQLNIIREESFKTSLTNTKLKEVNKIESTTKVREVFEATPKMSSYLLAFVVHNFDEKRSENKELGVWARPEAENQMSYSLAVGEKLVKELGTWMNYSFNEVPEIQKIDFIAVPDLNPNAMENWGAITYRENALLYDEKESSAANKQRIAQIITHELAHSWFGNLVTCNWWSEAWLNEGFANFFESFGTLLVEKDWDLATQFVIDNVQAVMATDAFRETLPLTNDEVFTPAEASAAFGSVSYKKGASIIRMIQQHMGEANFKKGLQNYLKEYQYQAVKPDKLFSVLNATNQDAKIFETFEAWTTQRGFPVLTVTSHENKTLKVNQKRFLLKEKEHNEVTRWPIPITYANTEQHFTDTATKMIFPSTQTTDFSFDLPENGNLGFYVLNVQQVGFYRVNYDKANWDAISKALKTETEMKKIHVLNRAQIVDDLFVFARQGLWSYDYVMSVVDYIKSEQHYVPWVPMFNGLTHLSRRIGLNSDYERFRKHILYLTDDLYKHLGFEPKANDAHTDTLSRTNLLTWMCKHGHENCMMLALDEFNKLETVPNYAVNPNIRIPVYCSAIRVGNDKQFNFLWNKYLSSNVAVEKTNILNTLGCAKTEPLIHNLLDKILSADVRSQDRNAAFENSYSNNHENVDFVFNYLTRNYKKWEEGMKVSVGSSLTDLSKYFTTMEQVNRLENFSKMVGLDENNVKIITAAVNEAKKELEWDMERLVEVRAYFKRLDDGNSATSVSISIFLLVLNVVSYFCLN